MVARLLPLGILLLVTIVAGWRLLAADTPDVSSRLVGQPAPSLELPAMVDTHPAIDGLATGEPRLVNLFGSWCNPCIAEAPLLDALAARGIPIDGIAVRDTQEAVGDFLDRYGDPFARIGADPNSQAMLALGVTGVPETFLIDREGVIRWHRQGPIEPGDVEAIARQWEALR